MAHANLKWHSGLSQGMCAEEMLYIITGNVTAVYKICEFILLIQNKLVQNV